MDTIQIREALCAALGFNADEMPFAGELIQIRDLDRAWEGAAERLLRSFALTLLVPDAHYKLVAEWVDSHQLRARLVYFHVLPRKGGALPEQHRDSVTRKLMIKSDSPYYEWLDRALAQRFDFACCATQEQFQREPRAITRAGQVKDPSGRHEKDDRYRIDDRSRYVLGWNNSAKIAALESKRGGLETSLGDVLDTMGKIQKERATLANRLDALTRLDEFNTFEELDWAGVAAEISELSDERKRLESASDELRLLNEQLRDRLEARKKTESDLLVARARCTTAEERRRVALELRTQTETLLAGVIVDEALSLKLEAMRAEALGEHQLTVESCDPRQLDVRNWLQTRIDAEDRKIKSLAEKIIKSMASFKAAFKLDTAEIDASLEAAFEYENLLTRLNRDDLPRFEARFKELLNVNTINEIANFNGQLARQRETIKDRVLPVSLRDSTRV